MAHKVFEQRKLSPGQLDERVVAPGALGKQVQTHVPGDDLRRLWLIQAACDRTNTGKQLFEGERFCQVIVGAGVESVYLVLDVVSRREHQHRQAGPR